MSKNINKIQISSSEDDKLQFGGNWLAKKLWRLERLIFKRYSVVNSRVKDIINYISNVEDRVNLLNDEHGQLSVQHVRINPNNGIEEEHVSYCSSEYIPINRRYSITASVNITAAASAIALYANDYSFIGAISTKINTIEGVSNGTYYELETDKIPSNAAYFRVCSIKNDSSRNYYTNGPMQESRDGAMSDTISNVVKSLDSKVNKENGKGLSTNDYTNEDKQKLSQLPTNSNFKADIAAKQDALTTSDDLVISQDNKLSLTDKAKYATFDAQWTAIGGTVVESGKTYSINGGTGDFADAVKAMTYYTEQPRADLSWLCFGKSLKLLPTIIVPNTASVNFSRAFTSLYGINKVVIKSTLDGGTIRVSDMFAAFNSSQVKELDCVLDVSAANNLSMAFPYSKIEEIRLKRLNDNISFPHSKNISLASLSYLVENAANGDKAITLTVHADVFAKLTDESNTEWHAVAVAALAKNITIAST